MLVAPSGGSRQQPALEHLLMGPPSPPSVPRFPGSGVVNRLNRVHSAETPRIPLLEALLSEDHFSDLFSSGPKARWYAPEPPESDMAGPLALWLMGAYNQRVPGPRPLEIS